MTAPISALKTVFSFLIAGAMAGAALGTLIGRAVLPWYNSPGSQTQALCNCPELVRGTVASLITYQLVGALLGAITFVVVAVLVLVSRSRRAVSPPTPPVVP